MSFRDPLLDAAFRARENAFPPYSGFKVGAAVEDKDGGIHTGCNIENCSYGLTVCAERLAVWKAMSEGVRPGGFRRVAIATASETLTPPCGACRQILWEFCGDVEILIGNVQGQTLSLRLSELFPRPFEDANIR